LDGFQKLREIVLQRTAESTRLSGEKVFHRTVIHKAIFTVALALFAALFLVSLQGGWAFRIISAGLLALPVLAITRDPSSLEIGHGEVVIRYPGWKRSIAFADIADIGSEDQMGGRGNVWAAVTIVRKRGKPIPLYRFREGSLALSGALLGALKAQRAGGGPGAPNRVR
jgi:hypothetical protein